jgi:hypothetical protein
LINQASCPCCVIDATQAEFSSTDAWGEPLHRESREVTSKGARRSKRKPYHECTSCGKRYTLSSLLGFLECRLITVIEFDYSGGDDAPGGVGTAGDAKNRRASNGGDGDGSGGGGAKPSLMRQSSSLVMKEKADKEEADKLAEDLAIMDGFNRDKRDDKMVAMLEMLAQQNIQQVEQAEKLMKSVAVLSKTVADNDTSMREANEAHHLELLRAQNATVSKILTMMINLEHSQSPSLATLVPKAKATGLMGKFKALTTDSFTLHLMCEMPDEQHLLTGEEGYKVSLPKKFIADVCPIISKMMKLACIGLQIIKIPGIR